MVDVPPMAKVNISLYPAVLQKYGLRLIRAAGPDINN